MQLGPAGETVSVVFVCLLEVWTWAYQSFSVQLEPGRRAGAHGKKHRFAYAKRLFVPTPGKNATYFEVFSQEPQTTSEMVSA